MGMARTAIWLFGLVGCAALPLAGARAEEPASPSLSASATPEALAAVPAVADRAAGEEAAPAPASHARADASCGIAIETAAAASFPVTVASGEGATRATETPASDARTFGWHIRPSSPDSAADASVGTADATIAPAGEGAVVVPLEPAAAAIAARLADLKGGWPPRLGSKDREAIAAWYRDAGYRPVWTSPQGWTAAAQSLRDSLRRADENGLDGADYAVSALAPAADESALASAEIRLAATALLYGRDARGGRINPTRISALITPKLDLPTADTLLPRLAASADAGAALEGYNPAYPGYRALRDKLATLRSDRLPSPMARLPAGPIVVSRRLASLDGSARASRLEGDIVANMERWRWLPAEVAPRYVLVNIPEFKLRLVEDGRVVHETRVVTGKAETPTPLFSGEMETAVVNPSWYIPPSIMKKEILPGLAADPGYAARRGYEVVRRGNQISVRQPPGERNALGFIKFLFPNQHAVYLHDTPSRGLFAASQRAFSHGCVRVEHPFELADFVLGHDWTEARLRKLIGRGERTIRLPEKLPVHLGYFTLGVDEFGELRSFDDVYGYNRRVRAALGLG